MTSDETPLPRVNWIRLELAWRGVLETQGLPVCPSVKLENADTSQALERCGGAAVGSGRLFATVFLPHQSPFAIRSRLVAFNAKTHAGRPEILVHAYSTHPPISFVIPFAFITSPGPSKRC